MKKIRFGLPKGHLAEATFRTLERAGYEIAGSERTYRPSLNDPDIELKILRPQEIPIFVSEGLQDVGITGLDWVKETQVEVEKLLDLEYSMVRLVIGIPKYWTSIKSLSDLLKHFAEKDIPLRISTEYLNISAKFLKKNTTYKRLYGKTDPVVITPWWTKGDNPNVVMYLSFGATEAKPPENADAIIEVIETGESLEQNDLKVIETVMHSTAILIANKGTLKDPEKREKIQDIITLLGGVVEGRKKLHVFVNVNAKNLDSLLKSLPALKRPTVSRLSDSDWFSVNTVIEKDIFIKIIPVLRKLAQGLVVYEPRQVLPLEELNLKGE